MLKPQDIVIALKILSSTRNINQKSIANELCMSGSEISAGVKRLIASQLAIKSEDNEIHIIKQNMLNFLIYGIKHVFPAEQGSPTIGIPTSYSSPLFSNILANKNSLGFVWPSPDGNEKGISFKPLYSSVPKSITKFKNTQLYNLLTIVDVLRSEQGRRFLTACDMLKKILDPNKNGKNKQ